MMTVRREPTAWSILPLIAGAVLLCLFALLFVLYNNHWIPVYVPSLPWSNAPVANGFETPLNVFAAGFFLAGASLVGAAWATWYRFNARNQSLARMDIEQIERELLTTQQLIAEKARQDAMPGDPNGDGEAR